MITKKFFLSFHYNGSNSFSYVNFRKLFTFKAKDSEIKPCPLYQSVLQNISKDFTANNMIKIVLNGYLLLILVILSIFINIQ